MIQPSELRLGNYILVGMKGLSRVAEVTGINKDNIDYILSLPEINTNYSGDQGLFGEPLTEEWLLKLGFKRVKNQFHDNYTIPVDENGVSYYHSVQFRNETFFYSNDESDAGCYVLTELKYVHQLQNLYFALTGEELELKEKA